MRGGQPHRLELRVGYPPEVPDPDFLSQRLLIDGPDAHAAVVLADGTIRTTELDGNSAVRDAQLQAVKFNSDVASAPGRP